MANDNAVASPAPASMKESGMARRFVTLFLLTALIAITWDSVSSSASGAEGPRASATGQVSYYEQVRPILVANCQGCHQPANASGGYVMMPFDKLLAGGS